MSPTLSVYILKYSYIAIFSLVFLQEIGVPNPVPNEMVLLFCGYLSSVGKLDCITVLITVIAADALGSSLLYMTFYYFGQRLLQKWPHVIPARKLAYLTARVSHQDRWSIYVGRHIPLLRGYTAVAAGLLQISPRIFLPAVLLSALTWSGGYVMAGKLLGHEYVDVVSKLAIRKIVLTGSVLVCIVGFLWPRIYHWLKKHTFLSGATPWATAETTRSESMKILIVSVNAGGGHTTAMYSLLLSLQRFAPDVNVGYFASPNRTLEHIHRLAYTKASYLYNAFYKATGQSTVWHKAYFGVTYSSIRSFYSELAPLLGEYDAVISTHFMQTYALLKAKYTLGLATKIIAYVPDFDHSYIHVPCYANLRVDAVLAQGTLLLEKLARLYNFAPEQIQRAGFLPRSTFTDVRTLSAAQARERVAALDIPLVSHLRADAFTVVVTGGSYWTMELYSVLKHLASCSVNEATPAFTRPANQILLVCGHNTKAYRAYSDLRHTTGLNLIPLPFLPAEQLAAVFRSADATVLASVAPATLYELLEAKSGPLLVHRINPGPEQGNLSFLLQHRLASYLPDPQELRHVLLRLSASPQYRVHWQQAFWPAAERERTAAHERAHQNAEFIVHVAAQKEADPSRRLAADGHVSALSL